MEAAEPDWLREFSPRMTAPDTGWERFSKCLYPIAEKSLNNEKPPAVETDCRELNHFAPRLSAPEIYTLFTNASAFFKVQQVK